MFHMAQQRVTARGILTDGNKIFTAKRATTKRYFPGIFELPGGWVDFGEHPETTVIREFKEECALDVEIASFACSGSQILEGDHLVEIYFFVRKQDPTQEPQLNEKDHSEARWWDQQSFLLEWETSHPDYLAVKQAFESLNA